MRNAWTAPVRYVECDQQSIVFNAHYLTWCDESMTAWMAAVGTPYDVLRARGLDTHVVSSTLNWAASASFGDVVEVDVQPDRLGNSSFTIAFAVRVGDQVCCTVRSTYVLVDADGRPTPLPADVRAAWT